MAKSNLQLLQEALAKGDLEGASALADKIAGPKAKVKPKPKAKAKPKSKAPAKRDDIDESSYLAPSRLTDSFDPSAGKKFTDENGVQHTYAKRVSLEGKKFVNKFKPEGYEDLTAKEKKLEKGIKALKPVPRPGQKGAQRDVSEKVKVRCVICHEIVEVYPWEAATVDGSSNFRCSKKSCVKAR